MRLYETKSGTRTSRNQQTYYSISGQTVDSDSFRSLSKFICRLGTINSSSLTTILFINLPLRRTLIPEEDKSRYRSRLTDEYLKFCLYFCLSNYGPSFSNLSQEMQCSALTSQYEAYRRTLFNYGKLFQFEKYEFLINATIVLYMFDVIVLFYISLRKVK